MAPFDPLAPNPQRPTYDLLGLGRQSATLALQIGLPGELRRGLPRAVGDAECPAVKPRRPSAEGDARGPTLTGADREKALGASRGGAARPRTLSRRPGLPERGGLLEKGVRWTVRRPPSVGSLW